MNPELTRLKDELTWTREEFQHLQARIADLTAEIERLTPKPLLVVARTFVDAKHWCAFHGLEDIARNRNVRYVRTAETVRGYRYNPVVFVGNFYHRPDIDEIFTALDLSNVTTSFTLDDYRV